MSKAVFPHDLLQPGTAAQEIVAPVRRALVLLPLPLEGTLDYAVPPALHAPPGSIVRVTLGRRELIGVVWDGVSDQAVPTARLKPVQALLPEFRIGRSLRRFIDWVANYTLAPRGEVLALALRPQALGPDRPVWGVRVAPNHTGLSRRLSTVRQRVIETLADGLMLVAELAVSARVSSQVVRAMTAAGLLERVELIAAKGTPQLPVHKPPELSPDQAKAALALTKAVTEQSFSVTLLQGATGSGKTEVYFEAVRACVAAGRQALILLPEIALSSQWLQRFEARFGMAPAVWHSDLAGRQRRESWREAARGTAAVLVGARSALFLPFKNLGLIVVDEEHEAAFKQEDGVVYHARDMAVVRARLCGACVVLASATPSLETLYNIQAGRYLHLDLPVRFGGAAMPTLTAIDLRAHPPERGSFLSPTLIEAIGQTLGRGEQAMLFLNRRGYAPLTLCRTCGHRIQCPNCTAWLVEHRLRRVLLCHHCGHTAPAPAACPACGACGNLEAIGPGVERITEEVQARFPDARRLIMASDTMSGPHAAAVAARAIEQREVDLIIGTQIVAKGWHFPHLTLVGVVDADLGLASGDLRAGERTMQLLQQVSGRAGREQQPGRVMLQTHQPEHPVVQALIAGDLEGFMRAEAAQRRPGHWPPYGRLAAVIVSAKDAADADDVAASLGRAAPRGEGVIVLGPAPAPLALLRGRHRRRLLLRARREVSIQPLLRQWLAEVKAPRRVRIDVDVDPISFM